MAHDLEDIEDIRAAGDPQKAAVLRELPPQLVRKRSVSSAKAEDAVADLAGSGKDAALSGVPGTQRVWVKTFGCSHNFSDGEYMAGLLQAYGYRQGLGRPHIWLFPLTRHNAACHVLPAAQRRCQGADI